MSDKDIKKKLHSKIDEIEKYGHVVADISPDELRRLIEIAESMTRDEYTQHMEDYGEHLYISKNQAEKEYLEEQLKFIEEIKGRIEG